MAEKRSITWKHRWSILPLGSLIVLAILIPNQIWNVLLATLGGIYLISYFWSRELYRRLSAERHLNGGWLAVGDTLSEQFFLRNDSALPALWVELTDESNIPGYRPSVAYQVPGQSEYKWRQTAVCYQRGRFTIGPWRLRTGDPFGLFEIVIDYPQTNEMVIYPPLDANINFSLPTGLQQGNVIGRDRALQVTNNMSGVRAYQPMDPLNWIHWPSTARTGELAVREFDVEAAGDAWILIDLESRWHTGEGLESTEEIAVILASALTTRILAQNRAVGLATYGHNPKILVSQKGEPQHWRILSTLAELETDGTTPLETTLDDLQQVISRESALIIITPNPEGEWASKLLNLSRKQIKTTVILLDRLSFEASVSEANDSAQNLETTIQKMGHRVQVIRQGDIKLPAVTAEDEGEFRVTPLGRAVRMQTDG